MTFNVYRSWHPGTRDSCRSARPTFFVFCALFPTVASGCHKGTKMPFYYFGEYAWLRLLAISPVFLEPRPLQSQVLGRNVSPCHPQAHRKHESNLPKQGASSTQRLWSNCNYSTLHSFIHSLLHQLIHLFSKYSVSAYYLDSGDTAVNKVRTLVQLMFLGYLLRQRYFRVPSSTEERATSSLCLDRSWKPLLRREHLGWVLKNE